MPKLIFIEGVSGVGKSTMVRALTERLRAKGRRVRTYLEFDADNPLDFYCTACLPRAEYAALCRESPRQAAALAARALDAGDFVLVRYYDRDTPLFAEPLLGTLAAREFCWHPPRPVPLATYSAVMAAVWRNYAAAPDDADFVLFDGSLLFHPLNDMTRNYAAAPEAMAAHVRALLTGLGGLPWRVFYLRTDDYAAQLARARRDRGQTPPDEARLRFWTDRERTNQYVLDKIGRNITVCDITGGRWDAAAAEIFAQIMEKRREP